MRHQSNAMTIGFRATAAALALALVATGCTGAGRSQPSDGEAAETMISNCPDLVLIACEDQVAAAEIPIAGTGMALHYRSDRVPGRTVAPRWDAAAAVDFGGWTLTTQHVYDVGRHTLFAGSGETRSVDAVPGTGDELQVASVDGAEVYTFSAGGRHLSTTDATTGVTIHRFEYDSDGRLAAIDGCRSDRIEIRRTPAGLPFEIVASGGHRTTMYTDSGGYLSTVTDPVRGSTFTTYDTGGLLTSLADAGGRTQHFEYDADGRLVGRTDPAGVITRYARASKGDRATVTITTGDQPPVRTTSENVGPGIDRHSIDLPGYGHAEETIEPGQRSIQLPDGTRIDATLEPDLQWGMQAPVLAESVTTTPNGTELRTSQERTATELRETVAGETTTTTWDPASSTFTTTDPSGRSTTETLDECGNPTAISTPGQAPVAIAYDERGRPVEIAQGAARERVTTASYLDDTGEVEITDAIGGTWRLAPDPLGQIAAVVRPDGRRVTIQRGPSGEPIGVSIDGEQVQTLGWSPSGSLSSFGPTANGLDLDTVSFDDLGRPQRLDRPGGASVDYTWTDDGRLAGVGDVDLAYDPDTGQLVSATAPWVELAREYDGPLPTQQTTTGPVDGAVGWSYDDAGRLDSLDIAGVAETFGYDPDGGLIAAGDLTITRDPATGQVVATDAGVVHTDVRYDDFGALAGQSVTAAQLPIYESTYSRDALGRIVGCRETIGGEHHDATYTYDPAGRLTESTLDGEPTSYTFDNHDNRTSAGGVPATYDAADQLTARGDATYVHAPDGAIESVTTAAGTTRFDHDAAGNLTGATLPDGTDVTYVTDADGRRAGRLVGGELEQGFLYGDDTRPLAATGADGAIDRRFVYAGPGAPALIETDLGTSRVISDQTGSPRLVVDTTTGAVQQQLDFDPFGQTTSDTNPGFQPIGFGGGTADPALQTVAIDNRDFDPASGGFPSGGPGLFGGSSVTDPVNGGDVTADGPMSYDNYVVAPGPGATGNGATNGGGPGNGADPPEAPEADTEGGLDGLTAVGGGTTALGAGTGLLGGALHGTTLGGLLHGLGQAVSLGGAALSGYEAYHVSHEIDEGADTPFNNARLGAYTFAALAELGVFLGLAATPLVATFVGAALFFAAVALVIAIYSQIAGARSAGDPHVTTFDGRAFEFQAVGEFVLTRDEAGSFEVQVRQGPTDHRVSINTALAVDVGGDHVVVHAEASPPLRVNGVPVDLPAGSIDLPNGGTIVRHPTGEISIHGTDDGDVVVVRIVRRYQLAIVVTVADEKHGRVQGVYGNANGDPDDDLASSDGQVVDSAPTDATGPLYTIFGNSWRVTQAESLFDYEPGTDTTTFTDLAFPASVASVETLDPSRRLLAAAACRAGGVTVQPFLDNCTLDLALMDDTALVTPALEAQQAARNAAATGLLDAPAAVNFDIAIGDTIGRDQPSAGAGHVEAGEIQQYTFTADAGQIVLIEHQEGDCALTIDIAQESRMFAVEAGCNDVGPLTLEAGGEYVIRVGSHNGADGNYGFHLIAVPPTTNDPISVGATVTGELETNGAVDAYTITAEPGQIIFIEHHTGDCTLTIDVADEAHRIAVGGACNDIGPITLEAGGAYVIRVARNAPVAAAGEYSFQVVAVPATTNAPIAIGDTVTGQLETKGAVDAFTFTADAGQIVLIEHQEGDCALTIDIAQESRMFAVGAGCNDVGPLTLEAGGEYVIRVARNAAPDGGYRFRLRTP